MKEILYQTDPSGKYSRKDYLIKYHNDLYNDIIKYSNDNDISDISFKEQVYCYKHSILPPLCKNSGCNKKVKLQNSTLGYREYCSTKCISNSSEIKKIKEQKSIEKFGTKTPAESQVIKDKMIKTNNERYGSNCSLQNKEIQKKSKTTLMKNYGVDHPLKSQDIQEKRMSHFDIGKWRLNFEKTMSDRYGVKNALQNIEIKNKVKRTNKIRYGVENPNQNKDINLKRLDSRDEVKYQKNLTTTMLNKYGVKNSMELKEFRDKISLTQRNKEKELNENIIDVDIDNREFIMICDCGKEHQFRTSYSLYKNRKYSKLKFCTICFPPYKNNISQLETELLNFVKDNYDGEIILNSKSIIAPYEIDIYLPELKLAIEFNGVYWHNELIKSNDYHKIKSDMCDNQEIQLIHIYEDDWIYKKNIVKSMILNKLGKTSNRIYARKCIIKEINSNESTTFLNNNHIQGSVNSSIKLGLFYNNELVSLMTFGKLRKSMNSQSKENEYEMLRFCNKLNTNVIGGASKLFSYFLKNYNPISITSYADRSYSNGNLYRQLGFKLSHITEPNYYYVVDDIRKYRFGFRKDILVKQGYDPNKSEHQIMLERKIYRIYNSGNYKFIYEEKKPTI